MVDSKEIEELRALVFASIPTVARKAAGSSTLKGKRSRTSTDTEEGEILSDEDAVAAMVPAVPIVTSATESHLDHSYDASIVLTKQRETLPVSSELPASISTETPSLVSVVPSNVRTMAFEENGNLASDKASVVWTSKDESGTQAAFRADSAMKAELPKFNQRIPKMRNDSRPLKSATGSLPSRIPIAPLPTGGLRKEAEAFLASLNLPAMATSSHLSGLTGDRNDSLVIKFSDDDSDSDVEQDGQVSKDRYNSKKLIGGEPQLSSSSGIPRTGLVSQATSGLISEIDRVKRQIAAIERAKGGLPVSRPSKSSTVEIPRQLNSKPQVPTTSASLRTAPIDLERLRQQIAAKESELKRRKQRGSKEFLNNGIASSSSWLIDTLPAPGARLFPAEKSESDAGVAETWAEEVPTMAELQANEASNSNISSVKFERVAACGLNCEQDNTSVGGVLAMMTVLPAASATECVVVGSDAQFADNNVEPALSEITKPLPEKCDLVSTDTGKLDMSGVKTSFTPKRKRKESDLRSESIKRAKRKDYVSTPGSSVMLDGPNEALDYHNPDSIGCLLDGSNVAAVLVSDGGQLSESKELLMPMQGAPVAVATTKPHQDVHLQTGFMQKASDLQISVMQKASFGMDVSPSNCNITTNDADENASESVDLLLQSCTEHSPGKVDNTPQIGDIVQSAETMKHLNTSVDMAFSSHASLSRAMVEQQVNCGVVSREQELCQGSLVGVSSTCFSLPIWDTRNENVSFLQDVSEQRLEYGNDSIWKLQEEEDAIDKQLEEAQKNRRKCEVREHFARRQYRDAQEALHAANLRCEMLFQKRELLSARVKAAQIQLLSNKSSLMTRQGEGALFSLGVPGFSGKDLFSCGTSIWATETLKEGNASLDLMSDQDGDGFHPDFSRAANQVKTSRRLSGTEYRSSNVGGFEEGMLLDSSARPIECQPGVLVHDKDPKVQGSQPLLVQDLSTGIQAEETGLCSGDLVTDTVSQSDIGKEKCQTPSEVRLASGFSAEEVAEKESHGFSSASFATDLERDGNQTSIMSEKSGTVKGQETVTRENNSSSRPLHLNMAQVSLNDRVAPSKSHDESLSASLKGHSKVQVFDRDSEPQCGTHSEEVIHLSQELKQQHYEPVAGERPDTSTKQISNFNSVTETFQKRQVSYPLEAQISRVNSLNVVWSSEDKRMELDDVQEGCKDIVSYERKLHMDSSVLHCWNSVVSENQGLPVVDPGKESQLLVGNSRTELDIVPVSNMLCLTSSQGHSEQPTSLDQFHRSDEHHRSEQSRSSVGLATSTSLNLLFSLYQHPRSSNIWKQLNNPGKIDQTMYSMSENYESPLCAFHSYRARLQSKEVLFSRSFSSSHNLNPHKVLCMFEHRGKCNNDECNWQHKRDYLPASCQKESHQVVETPTGPGPFIEKTEREDLNSTGLKQRGCSGADESSLHEALSRTSWKWNVQSTKVPVYRIGSHLTRMQSFESLLSSMILKEQFRSGMPFFALHRQAAMDMPCLLDLSLKLPTLNDGSIVSRQLRMEDRLWIQDEGNYSGTFGDAESLLEATLELFDYDVKVQKSELRKNVLYVLSRGLEVNPCSVALWVVYLHLFYRWEKGLSKDDLFFSALQHNNGSYELWVMFINSRRHLKDRLEAYESAIIAFGSRIDLQTSESKSSLLLDLALRKLNCLCMSDLKQEATSWISNFIQLASEDGQCLEKDKASSCFTLLNSLMRPDLCILWICCAFVILQSRLPDNVVECLGCKQQLCFENIWLDTTNVSSCATQVMRLMRIAVSDGKGCMKLDVPEPVDKNLLLAKAVFAANFVHCAAICEGLDHSLALAEKYFKLLSPSVELTLLRARLEENYRSKMASLNIFEQALTHWPLDQSGKLRLWNQYIGCALEVKGPDFVKGLFARCAREICDSDSFRFICGNLGNSHSTSLNSTQQTTAAYLQGRPVEDSSNSLQRACQLLPLIVKRQLMKASGFSGQQFSYEDAVFAHVNLAFSETLNEDYKAARIALQCALNMAVDTDSIRHCLREIAVFTFKGLDKSTSLSPSVYFNKMLGLVDRCIVESQMLGAMRPLSKGFCDSIQRRRVSQFVDSLLCPSPTNSSFLNSLLESIHGPTLLPSETVAWTDFLDFSEKVLEVLPSNVRLATSVCRIVKSKAAELDSKAGPATLFWSTSLLVDSLCQASPGAPEPRWVEAAGFIKMLEIDSLLEEFYWLALSVHPFSSSLWYGLLEVSRKTGNLESALKSAREGGVKLDLDLTS